MNVPGAMKRTESDLDHSDYIEAGHPVGARFQVKIENHKISCTAIAS